MKITAHQLRRVIREQLRPYDPEEDPDQWMEDRHGDEQMDLEYYLAGELEKALIANPGIDGLSLVDIVKTGELGHLFNSFSQDDVFNMLDEMIEDGTAYLDVEEDEWHYAPGMRR